MDVGDSTRSGSDLRDLVEVAKKQGFITEEELLKAYPKVEQCIAEIDELFAQLLEEGVELVLQEGEAEEPLMDDEPLAEMAEEFGEPDEEEIQNLEFEQENSPEDDSSVLLETFDYSRKSVDLDGISIDDTVSLYLKQMGQVSLLTAAEEVMLAKQIEEGEQARARLKRCPNLSPEQCEKLKEVIAQGEKARTRLIEANTRLVVSIAKKYIGQGVPLLDLIQEGNIGLMKAVEKFDYHRGYKFSTYATWWIRQGITRALAQQSRLIRLPVHAGDQIRRIYRVIEHFEQEEGRRPSPEEIAEQTGIPVSKVERLMRISRYPVSLERPVGDDGDTEFGDFIEDEESPAPTDMAYRQLLREALEELMTALSPREMRILLLRFGLRDGRTHTLEEVGEKFGLTRERIRQIEHQALDRLRRPRRSKLLRDYLR